MTQNVQSQSSRPEGAKGFIGLLGNALFWLVMAIVLPVGAIVHMFPEIAPYAHWAPTAFYALALISFLRALRVLQRLTGSRRMPTLGQPRQASAATQSVAAKPAADASRLPVNRKPTVQRMR